MITYVGKTSVFTATSTQDLVSAALPAGWKPGDLLVCVTKSNFRDYFDVPAEGWSHFPDSPNRSGGSTAYRVTATVMYRVAKSGDTTWTFPRTAWQSGSAAGASGVILVYRSDGVFLDPPYGVTAYDEYQDDGYGGVVGRGSAVILDLTVGAFAIGVARKDGALTQGAGGYTERHVGNNMWVGDIAIEGAAGTQAVSSTTALMDVTWAIELVDGTAPPLEYHRMLMQLLPPGRLWRLDEDGLLSRVQMGAAEELARVGQRVLDLIRESDPRETEELLADFEAMLALDAEGTDDERRARTVALLIRRQRFRPADFQQALAPLLGQDPDDVVVIEQSRAFAVSVGDDREIYRFFIYRDPSEPGAYDLASAQDLVDRMKPAHTLGHVIESLDFECDDPNSLCDRDRLGV